MQFVSILFVVFYFSVVISVSPGKQPHQETPCSATGGMCYEKKYCGEIPQEGLCPEQQSDGVECCFKITGPVQETPSGPNEDCGLTGSCREKCPDNLIDQLGSCTNNLKCCVLV